MFLPLDDTNPPGACAPAVPPCGVCGGYGIGGAFPVFLPLDDTNPPGGWAPAPCGGVDIYEIGPVLPLIFEGPVLPIVFELSLNIAFYSFG